MDKLLFNSFYWSFSHMNFQVKLNSWQKLFKIFSLKRKNNILILHLKMTYNGGKSSRWKFGECLYKIKPNLRNLKKQEKLLKKKFKPICSFYFKILIYTNRYICVWEGIYMCVCACVLTDFLKILTACQPVLFGA